MMSFQKILFFMFVVVSTASAFQSSPIVSFNSHHPAAVHDFATARFLHPDQAADLEACAYALMKEEAMEAENQGAVAEGVLTNENNATFKGPVAWCRRRLWPFAKNNHKLELKP